MPFYLRAKKLDIESGDFPEVILNETEARNFGIHPGDRVGLSWHKRKRFFAIVDVAEHEIRPGEIGLFEDIWMKYPLRKNEIIEMAQVERPPSIEAIKKKMRGERLTYEEIYSIISDIVKHKIGKVEITYFVAASFEHHSSREELYYLTKAMAETGEQLRLPGKIVVDKHSIGGLAGNRTTMLVVPIIASLGLCIPKTSSRAITSPSGTADTMEVLAPVTFGMHRIKQMVLQNNGCLIWGGGLSIAPADDLIIQVSRPLSLEPFDKMIVSIMAKKVAMGVRYLVIDMPHGPSTKVPNLAKAKELEEKFLYLGKKFQMKIKVVKMLAREPIGRGVGPALEARDVLRVLQQKELRPKDLEKKAMILAGELLELVGKAKKGQGQNLAKQAITSGAAWKKMREIIRAQGGHGSIDSDQVTIGGEYKRIFTNQNGRIVFVDNRAIDFIARTLGAPQEKPAGLHLHKRIGDSVKAGDKLYTLYAERRDRIALALKALENNKIFEIK